jgi:hypothetical protein
MRFLLTLLVMATLGTCVLAQTGYTKVNGKYYPYTVDECGDTLILAQLTDVSVSSPEVFNSDDEYKQYRRYRIYAQRAYPYAVDAIRVFRETEYMTQNMSKRERRKYIKKLQKELKEKFEDPLKKMSKTQGKVLIAMIERELGRADIRSDQRPPRRAHRPLLGYPGRLLRPPPQEEIHHRG